MDQKYPLKCNDHWYEIILIKIVLMKHDLEYPPLQDVLGSG